MKNIMPPYTFMFFFFFEAFAFIHDVNASREQDFSIDTFDNNLKVGFYYSSTLGYTTKSLYPDFVRDLYPYSVDLRSPSLLGVVVNVNKRICHLKDKVYLNADVSYGLYQNKVQLFVNQRLRSKEENLSFSIPNLHVVSLGVMCTLPFNLKKQSFELMFGLLYTTGRIPEIDKSGTLIDTTGQIVKWTLHGERSIPKPVLTPSWGLRYQLPSMMFCAIQLNLRYSYTSFGANYELKFIETDNSKYRVGLGNGLSSYNLGVSVTPKLRHRQHAK